MMNGVVKYSGYKKATNKAIKGLKNNRKRKRERIRSEERSRRANMDKMKKIREYKAENDDGNKYERKYEG